MTDTLTLDNAPPPAAPPAKLTLAQAVLAEAEKQSLKHRQRSLTTDEQVGIARAFSTRGKGILLARSPSEPWARAAWNGLQPNAFKVSIGACLFLPDGPREFLTFLTDHVPLPATADRDSAALQAMGVWR